MSASIQFARSLTRRLAVILAAVGIAVACEAPTLPDAGIIAARGGKPTPPPPPSGPADPAIVFSDGSDLVVMNADGSHRTVVGSFSGEVPWATWSPDRGTVAFSGPNCCYSLSLLDIGLIDGVPSGSGYRSLVDTTTGFPTWSPGGDVIAVHGSVPSGGTGIIGVPVSGGTASVLLDLPVGERAHFVDWSPNGLEIAYVQGEALNVLTLATGSVRTVAVSDPTFVLFGELDWSADGTLLALTALVPKSRGKGNEYRLFTVDAANGTVSSLGVTGRSPAWSPDGSQIVFESTSGRNGGIMVLTLSTGQVVELAGSGRFPDWRK